MRSSRRDVGAVTALVLGGGAARGAYEAGVVQYCFEDVARTLGHPVHFAVRCGTSVGAINTCLLAAHAQDPAGGASQLVAEWTALRVESIVRPEPCEALALARGLFTAPVRGARGGLLDPRGLAALVRRAVSFEQLRDNVRTGVLDAVSLTTTHVASGRTVVFVDRREEGLPPWRDDPGVEARRATLRPAHALASAAIPVLFPPQSIDGQKYYDGGLRQFVPLSPAHRLGASRVVVVSPQHPVDRATPIPRAVAREQSVGSPMYLAGKALDALLGERLDADVDRLETINALLDAGRRRYGGGFLDAVNAEMGRHGPPALRHIQLSVVRASQPLGLLARDYVGTRLFRARVRGALGLALRRLADADPEGDLLSYLLFDGGFAAQLVELGRADARHHHDELCALLEGAEPFKAPAKPAPDRAPARAPTRSIRTPSSWRRRTRTPRPRP